MVSTQVGYAGGTTTQPTYYHIGDHSESVQVVYDPAVLSYARLLEVFWESHDPAVRAYSRQYRSVIFVATEEQRRLAEESKRREEARRKQPVYTEIVPAGTFTPAEDYHQKYYLRAEPLLLAELRARFPREEEMEASTAAARINGYLGGYGTREELEAVLHSLGLSPRGEEQLRRRVSRHASCPAPAPVHDRG